MAAPGTRSRGSEKSLFTKRITVFAEWTAGYADSLDISAKADALRDSLSKERMLSESECKANRRMDADPAMELISHS